MYTAVLSFVSNFSCSQCSAGTTLLSGLLKRPEIEFAVINVGIFICEEFKLAEDAENVCPGLVKAMGKPIVAVVRDRLLTEERVCGEWLRWCDSAVPTQLSIDGYSDNLGIDAKYDNFVNNLYKTVKKENTLKIVHMSDAHVDKLYTEGALARCESYVCCREENGFPHVR